MNEITKYRPQFPVLKQWQLDRQRSHMEYITRLAIGAMGEQSQMYRYIVFEVLDTMDSAMRLKTAYFVNGMPPEIEAVFQNLTSNYLRAMEQIPTEACRYILQVLQRASPEPDDGGLLGFVINAFFNRLYGK